MKNIISIDGGGTGGVFMFHMLNKIVKEYVSYKPDLIVGVSAGAIIGAMLATNRMDTLSTNKIEEYITRTFGGEENRKGPWFRPKFKGDVKTNLLFEVFGNMKLGDVDIELAIITDIVDDVPVILTSWEHGDIPLYIALDSTSAIPVLFPPVTIDKKQYVDGGTVTTSPICISALLGSKYFDVPISEIRMCSLGLLQKPMHQNKFKNEEMGIIQWMALGIPIKLLTQRSFLENMLLSQILGSDKYIRIESTYNGRVDNTDMFDIYLKDVEHVWNIRKDDIESFFKNDYV